MTAHDIWNAHRHHQRPNPLVLSKQFIVQHLISFCSQSVSWSIPITVFICYWNFYCYTWHESNKSQHRYLIAAYLSCWVCDCLFDQHVFPNKCVHRDKELRNQKFVRIIHSIDLSAGEKRTLQYQIQHVWILENILSYSPCFCWCLCFFFGDALFHIIYLGYPVMKKMNSRIKHIK